MRYLALPELEQLNALLSSIDCDDGSRIYGRLEAYSCKAAGADKKLWKQIVERFTGGLPEGSNEIELALSSSPPHHQNPNNSAGLMGEAGPLGLNLKLLYYLIATMNLVFPDYDFSELPPDTFRSEELTTVVRHVNTTLFNTGLNKNVASFEEFSSRMWDCVDKAIGLVDCEVYSYLSGDFDALDDPFWERGSMYCDHAYMYRRPLINCTIEM